MFCTWRSIGRWLAICCLLTPVALRAEDIRYILDDQSSAATASADEPKLRVVSGETDAPTYNQADPAVVLDQPEVLDSDVLLAANDDLTINNDAPVPELVEPQQTPLTISDQPIWQAAPAPQCDCCCRCRCWSLYAGTAATFLAPSHNTGGGSEILVGNYATGTTTLQRTATDRQMNISPRVWLGVQGECWGAVVRYWNWSSLVGGLSEVPAVLPLAGSAGTFTQNYLHLQTLDAEVTRYLKTYRSDVWFSFGFRYAAFQRSSSLLDVSRVGVLPTLISSSAMESTNFYGGGLTTGVFGKTPIRGTSLSWVYSGRASVVWDPSSKSLAMSDVIYGNTGFDNLRGGTNSAFSTLFMSEVQLGMQYDRALKFIPGNAFFRTAFEWQYWNLNHGNGMTAFSSGGAAPTSLPLGGFALAFSKASGTTLDMLGFNLATGFNW